MVYRKGYGFTAVDKEEVRSKFLAVPENKKLWDRLEETVNRLPWTRYLVDSLKDWIDHHGSLTANQKSLVTKLYLDCCITTEDRLAEQRTTRKLCYRLNELELGKLQVFISDVLYKTNTRPFTSGQINALNKIAQRHQKKLAEIPEILDENFDGWFFIEPDKSEVDNSEGIW